MIKITSIFIITILLLAGCEAVTQSPISTDPEKTSTTTDSIVSDPTWEYISTLPEEYQRLTIPNLRQQTYPGSQIQIESTVSDTASYTSYLSSYQSEGLRINALLTKPKTPMPDGGYPAVVFIHGYIPPAQYQTTERYQAYVDYLAKNGLVVFKIDLRGHGNSEGEPGGAYFSADYIYDSLNAYASLQQLDYVNPQKIGFWGHSMAGNVILRSMVVNPEIPLGVIWAGAVYTYTDMADFGIADASYQPSQNPNRNRRQELYDTVGQITPDNQFWSQVIPTNFTQELRGKVVLHHATNDNVVSIKYSQNLAQILSNQGVVYQLYEYTQGGHNLDSPSFNQAMERTVRDFQNL